MSSSVDKSKDDLNTPCCSACGSAADLKKCSRCCLAAYCGRDCQRNHWKEHKHACDEYTENIKQLHEMRGLSSSDPNNRDEETTVMNSISKQLRQMKREGVPVVHLTSTAGAVPANFSLKQQAYIELLLGPKAGARGNMKGEAAYRAYYDDLLEDRTWMSFFDHPDNSNHAEHTCGILGTLATVYRQRGTLQDCEAVLDLEVDVLKKYRAACTNTSMTTCCDALEYRMDLIRNNMCIQLERYLECVILFRKLADYELKYKVSFELQQVLYKTVAVLNKPPTDATLQSLSDGDVMQIVLKSLDGKCFSQGIEESKARVSFKTCASCRRSEATMGQFKHCTRCKSTFYCDQECQKKDWKAHKLVCSALR
jgi:hypothetical protein